jgi:hypothetical protein
MCLVAVSWGSKFERLVGGQNLASLIAGEHLCCKFARDMWIAFNELYHFYKLLDFS